MGGKTTTVKLIIQDLTLSFLLGRPIRLSLLDHPAIRIINIGEIDDSLCVLDREHLIVAVIRVLRDASIRVRHGRESSVGIVCVGDNAAAIILGLGDAVARINGELNPFTIGRGEPGYVFEVGPSDRDLVSITILDRPKIRIIDPSFKYINGPVFEG